MFYLKLKFTIITVFIFLFGIFNSCTRKASDYDDKNIETALIDQNDFSEENEDLLNVDYTKFYDELAPHGEWIKVTDNDIGLNITKKTSSNYKEERSITLSDLLGVKNAYASDVAFGAFFIWRPSPNLAVSIAAGDPAPYYIPYADGQWVYSDAGWYFLAPTPYEEIVHHYGRWIYSPSLGWVWIPGRVWAPAWVEWRVSYGYVGWAPIPPCVYIENYTIYPPVINEGRFIVVENRYFCEPVIYNYRQVNLNFGISSMTRVDGIFVKNGKIFNRGPNVKIIEKDRGSKIDMVKVNHVKEMKDSRKSNSEIFSYSPDFKRVKNSKNYGNESAFKPGKFEKFSEVKNRDGNKSFSGNEKGNVTDNNGAGKKDRANFKNDNDRNKNRNKNITKGSDNNKSRNLFRRKDQKNSGIDKQEKRNQQSNKYRQEKTNKPRIEKNKDNRNLQKQKDQNNNYKPEKQRNSDKSRNKNETNKSGNKKRK